MRIFTAVVFVCVCRAAPPPSMPDSVLALVGSCVLLPCRFPPAPGSDVRLRFRSAFPGLKVTGFSSDQTDQASRGQRQLKGRVSLYGELNSGDCSLTIANVSASDPSTLEIQLKQKRGSWGGTKSVQLIVNHVPHQPVITSPRAVVAGQVAVVNCSVPVSCPSQPPQLQWVWQRGGQEGSSGYEVTEMVQVKGELPRLVSSLSFTPTHLGKPRLRCDALYPGDRKSSVSTELHVHFPPKDVSIQVLTVVVRDGGNALLACVCKADPPVSEYHWNYTQSGRTHTLPGRSSTVRIFNITRDTMVQCSVRNTLGRATSPPTSANVQYSPTILKHSSSCDWNGFLMVCRCTVDSNPRPAITWSVNGSVPPPDYNTSSTSSTHSTHALQETLSGPALTPLTIVCYAFNGIGNDSYTLLQGGAGGWTGSLWTMMLGSGCLVLLLLVFFLLVLLLCRWRRAGRRRRLMSRRPPVFEDSVYQDRLPLYINCTEVTNIYTNGSYQLIYQNCTPCFVRTKQIHKRQRRGARRQRVQRERDRENPAEPTERETAPPTDPDLDPDTAIYVEVI
ncbi:sialic acid-binding Ig-like lectin 5 [Astyanax mexicanus]|uniref:sialic acid-binding Ig-like lectin 5 n=1 Tax=Astyanax mexicanus TaxID=7994 RepID=UPI0020CAB188|nr:sialic acid-binding Ig-like lectin 5 [Astyanax mexicanus]